MSTSEPIAQVIYDLKTRRVRSALPDDPQLAKVALDLIGENTVVIDATEIYKSLVARDAPIRVYEDHEDIRPPWTDFCICYVNEYGNVIVMHSRSDFRVKEYEFWDKLWTMNEGSWNDVECVISTFVWVGGKTKGVNPVHTTGPMHLWESAIAEDGRPIDLHWVQLLEKYPMKNWDMAQLVLLQSLNFLNCRNVEVVDVPLDRSTRRRMARSSPGVRVSTINVFPVGKSKRSGPAQTHGVPLTSVRGHKAHYGDCCPGRHVPKGKLFGKLTGVYWIPQHARGSTEFGEIEQNFKLREA